MYRVRMQGNRIRSNVSGLVKAKQNKHLTENIFKEFKKNPEALVEENNQIRNWYSRLCEVFEAHSLIFIWSEFYILPKLSKF